MQSHPSLRTEYESGCNHVDVGEIVLAAVRSSASNKPCKTEREISRVCEFNLADEYWNRVEGIRNGYLHAGVVLKGLDGFSAFWRHRRQQ